MKYTIITNDGTRYPFDASALAFVESAMKDGAVFQLGTDLIRGSDIKRVIKGADTGEYGPHSNDVDLPSLAASIFNTEAYGELFWKQVIDQNRIRQAAGKAWIFNACVNWAVAENRHRNVPELFAFIEAEWETAAQFNVPKFPNDSADIRGQRDFLATDAGKQYAMLWRRFDVQWNREHSKR